MRVRGAIWCLGALLIASVAGTARAEKRPVAVVAYGPGARSMEAGLAEAAHDTGRRRLEGAALRHRGGRHLARRAERCRRRTRCLGRLAGRLRAVLWVATATPRSGKLAIAVLGVAPGGGVVATVRLAGLTPDELLAGAYGAAFRGLGGRGRGRLFVSAGKVKADVVVGGSPAGPTPVLGYRVSAGAVRVRVSATGYLAWSRLLQVRPGAEKKVVARLKPDVTALPLLALVPKKKTPAGGAAAPAGPAPGGTAGATGPAGPGPAASTGLASTGTATASASPGGTSLAASGPGETTAHGSAAGPTDLTPSHVARTEPPRLRAVEVHRSSGVHATTWAVLGTGVAALAAGAYFGLSAAGNAQTAQNPMTPQVQVPGLNDTVRTQATAANVLIAAGAALVGTSSFLLVHDLSTGS